MLDAEIKLATCQVKCGSDTGTGWLVASDKVITALHCVSDAIDEDESAEISLTFEGRKVLGELTAHVIDYNQELDICLLSISSISDINPISVSERTPLEGSQFYSYGYPATKLTVSHRLEGTVSQIFNTPRLGMDIDLHIESIDTLAQYEGLSGAALICNGICFGVIRVAMDKTIGAISIARMGDFLQKHEIFPSDHADEESTNQQSIAPRKEFTLAFDDLVHTQSGGYVFIEGAHGIGKSTFCKLYTPSNPSLEHFATYSFTVERGTANTNQQAQPQEFFNWLNTQVSMLLTGDPGRLDKKDYLDLIKGIEELLARLGQEYIAREKVGVLFIDGLDEVEKISEGMLEKFLGLLPQRVPAGLAIVLSAPNYLRFATQLGTRLKNDNCLSIPALANSVVRDFCRQELLEIRSNPVVIKLICDRVQGHPLYLRYLIDLVNSGVNDEEIASLPLIEGSIRNYYDVLWNQLKDDVDAVNLLAIAVRLRWGVPLQQFTEILNQAEQGVLVSTIDRIRHLLLTPEETTIYHSSFSDFLVEKTQLRESDVQLRLAEYCDNHRNNSYGLLNVIHHCLQSEGTKKSYAVSLCDQGWADNCVIEDVEPDMLLSDVDRVLSAAIELGSLTETVRILLLSQRLQFRYDTLLAQSAELTANALIALGKTQEVLKHVIRYGQLIIPVPEALKVALRLTEASDYQSALELLSIIEILIAEQLNSSVRDGDGISFQEFLRLYDLQLQQFTIKIRAGGQNASLELGEFHFFWNEAIKDCVSDETAIKLIRTEMMQYLQAATMCLISRYMSVEQICQRYTGAVSELTEPLIYTASYYRELCNYFDVIPNQNLLDHVFADLQKLVSDDWDESKGIPPVIANNLVDLGVLSSMVRVISIELSESLPPIRFIAEDNVSMDEPLLNEGFISWRYAALVDSELPCPNLITLSGSDWKDGIDSIFRIIAWCDGSARRLKESADASGLEGVWSALQQNVFDQLRFKLAHRVEWEDAYALPEVVIPQVYHHLVILVADIYPNHLGYLVSFIEDQFDSQCGIYSEGFRNILAETLNYFTKIPLDDDVEDQLFSLTERWRDFVVANLQNRHELVPELLTIVPLFVRLNADEEAMRTYRLALSFSMGPSWYKESQFTLMITALKSSSPDLPTKPSLLNQISGLLDTADGEMTFQRFVRYAKSELIGALCERGDFTNAVDYFIRQTYGALEQLHEEATQGNVDRVSQLRGTRFPGNALDEQDSVLNIVKPAISACDWQLCWMALEIFQFGDSRHQNSYAEAYALLLAKFKQDQSATSKMMKRLELICESEVESEQRSEFLSSVQSHLPVELKEQFENLFGVHSAVSETELPQISSSSDNEKQESTEEQFSRDDILLPGTFGTESSIQKAKNAVSEAKRHLRRRNKLEAQKAALAGLESIQNGKWSIWGGQIGEISEGKKLLLEATDSASDVVKLCRPIILNDRYAERWCIADSLIEWLASNDSQDGQAELIRLTVEHIEVMVGNSENHVKSYDFLENPHNTDVSLSLIKLIFHAIDHPAWLRSEKAADMLLWLMRNYSQYIPIFGPKAFSMEDSIHPDVICGVLDQLSKASSEQLWDQLVPALDLGSLKQNCQHAGRLSVLMRIGSRAAQRGSESASHALTLLRENIATITQMSDTSQQIDGECPSWAELIKPQWFRLKAMGLANSELVERATAIMREQCFPFSIDTSLELEQLLTEGVRGNTSRPGRWEAKVRFAFQVALIPVMNTALLTQVEAAFRPYNPSRLDNLRIIGFSSPAADWLTQLEGGSGTPKPIRGKYIYLDFCERVWLESNWRHIRLTAYFYESGKTPQPKLPSGRFLSTEEAMSTDISSWDTCSNVELLPVYFSGFTPAMPSPTLMQATRATNADFVRAYWRSGRVSRNGGPEHEGCSLAMDTNALRLLPRGLEMAWVYEVDGKFYGMVTYS